MPKKPAKDEKDPVMDVTKPGKSEPNATSRPIIVSRKPIVEDPMNRPGGESDLIPGPPAVSKASRFKTLKRSKSIKISPEGSLEDDNESKPAEPEEEVKVKTDSPPAEKKEEKSKTPALASIKEIIEPDDEEEPAEEPAEEKPKEEAKPAEKKLTPPEPQETKDEDKPEEPKEEPTEEKDEKPEDKTTDEAEKKPDSNEEEVKATVQPTDGIVDELAKKAVDKKNKDKEDKEASVRQEQIDKLAESKKYALPIGEVTRRRNNRISLIVLVVVILLAAVAANFAVDAGLIQTDIKPLTDVIPN